MARLRLSPDEELKFVSQLGRIVEYIDQLAEYPVGVPTLLPAGVAEAGDQVAPCLDRSLVLANAPETFDAFVVVPQIKGDDG